MRMTSVPGGEPEKIDIIWLVEHVAREFDVASLVKAIAARRYGLNVEIRNIYQHIGQYLPVFDPAVIVHPFVYIVEGALATEDIFRRWPDAVHVNAAWEQIHYRAHYKIKAPADKTAREQVTHFAWGNFYKNFLIDAGVPPDNIVINGHPAYQLYREPYRSLFDDRRRLATRHGLDPNKEWIFVPENYRWAFAQKKLKFFVSLGGDREELQSLIEFSIPSLIELLRACREASRNDDVEIIFRPRPAINTERILDFFQKEIGSDLGRIRIIKEGSVREWVLASDKVISSYSTSLLEAAVAAKPSWMFEPIPIPESLHCEWYDSAPRIRTAAEFVQVCMKRDMKTHRPMADWVHTHLLPDSDPIEKIVEELRKLRAGVPDDRKLGPLPTDLHTKQYFNKDSHEMDEFTASDAEQNSSRWSSHIFGQATPQTTQIEAGTSDIINKTMDRDDLTQPDAVLLTSKLNSVIRSMHSRGISPTSWSGTLFRQPIRREESGLFRRIKKLLGRTSTEGHSDGTSRNTASPRGAVKRIDYSPLDGAEDDVCFPWFLYWKIHWALSCMQPHLKPGMRLLDAGSPASLFTCYMATQGYEVHTIASSEKQLALGRELSKVMGWASIHSHPMTMTKLHFPDAHFDHAFVLDAYQHLKPDVGNSATGEIARCLKPGGILALTFPYRQLAPCSMTGYDSASPFEKSGYRDDICGRYLASGPSSLLGNREFADNSKFYVQDPAGKEAPYTFGAIFLQKT
jgi:surface carbohydrate biosynthesis protein